MLGTLPGSPSFGSLANFGWSEVYHSDNGIQSCNTDAY